MNLAENCKAHLPRWLNYVLYFFAESAIIATDIAEVRQLFMVTCDVVLTYTGYWHSYCLEYSFESALGCRVRHFHC
jgi:hypothetical protein